ncbi:MAG: septum formation initiator [Chitinophagaceae bacterium]
MKLLTTTFRIIRNKYLLTFTAFALWVIFFDKNDFFTQRYRKQELKELHQSKKYYEQQIAEIKQFSSDLKSNPAAIEKFAREKYKMKRDSEDLFIVKFVANK